MATSKPSRNKPKPKKPAAASKRGGSTGASRVWGAAATLALIPVAGIAIALYRSPPDTGLRRLLSAVNLNNATAAAAADGRSRGGECVDISPMCEPWHKAGGCRGYSAYVSRAGIPANVREQCPESCGLCEGKAGRGPAIPREQRCRRDNSSAAVPSGQLHRLFERVMSDYPQFSPVALSKDPWLVQLNDFISDEEADAFVERCSEKFDRSLAGDQLNPVRTSYQCWCNFPGCYADPRIHNVTRRMSEVTGTLYNHGEDLQIVRYEPEQFYRVHHDQNTAVWAPQGPRVLTFFIYLNTPTKGGGTRFPQVSGGVTVQAKQGSALLWPSTLDAEPMSTDDRTMHEAMPVEEGIKFGANMWVHQFDFKTPSERGCELTYVNTFGQAPSSEEHRRLVEGLVPTAQETIRMA